VTANVEIPTPPPDKLFQVNEDRTPGNKKVVLKQKSHSQRLKKIVNTSQSNVQKRVGKTLSPQPSSEKSTTQPILTTKGTTDSPVASARKLTETLEQPRASESSEKPAVNPPSKKPENQPFSQRMERPSTSYEEPHRTRSLSSAGRSQDRSFLSENSLQDESFRESFMPPTSLIDDTPSSQKQVSKGTSEDKATRVAKRILSDTGALHRVLHIYGSSHCIPARCFHILPVFMSPLILPFLSFSTNGQNVIFFLFPKRLINLDLFKKKKVKDTYNFTFCLILMKIKV